MKIVIGEREHKLTWRDGTFLGGVAVALGGLGFAFGWGIVVASVGAGMIVASRLQVAT